MSADDYCKQAKQVLEYRTTFDKVLSIFGYNILKNKIKTAIALYSQAISQYYIIKNYDKVIECYQEIAYLQAKPDIAIDTLITALNVAIEHNIEFAGELAESVIARHKYVVHPTKLLRFYEVCADIYFGQTCYKECVDCLYMLSTIYASQTLSVNACEKCETLYENIIYLYITKLNKLNLACVSCDTLLLLYCKTPAKIEFYDNLRTLLKVEHKDVAEIHKFVSHLNYISILHV